MLNWGDAETGEWKEASSGGEFFRVGGGAELEESWSGRNRITAEVDGVRSDYTITYGRYGKDNAAMAYAYARADAPGGREADTEKFSALVKALTGEEPGCTA